MKSTKEIVPRKRVSKSTLEKADLILKYLCNKFSMTEEIVKSGSRKKEVIKVKKYFSYLCCNNLYIKLAQVSNKINVCNHTTALYHFQSVQELMSIYKDEKEIVNQMEKEVKAILNEYDRNKTGCKVLLNLHTSKNRVAQNYF